MCCRRRNRTPLIITAASLVAKKIADHREAQSTSRRNPSANIAYLQESGTTYPQEKTQPLEQIQSNEDQPPHYTENDDTPSLSSSLTATPVITRSAHPQTHPYYHNNNESGCTHTSYCHQSACTGQCVANHQNLSNCQIHRLERQARWMERKELKAREKEIRLMEKMARKEEKVLRKAARQ